MDATTLTASKLYDLSTIVVPDWDDNYRIDPREVHNFYRILADVDSETMYRASYRRHVARTWNEAHIENDHRDALLLNEAYSIRADGPAPVVQESREAQAHALAVMRAREERTLAEVAQLRTEVNRLRNEQITEGDDPRLEQFWEKAMDAANDANFCNEYDRIAEMMGGPTRSVTYDVDLTVTLRSSVTVTVRRGEEVNRSELRDQISLSDIESNLSSVDWSDVEVEDYNEVDSY